jgi:hypothetical protein
VSNRLNVTATEVAKWVFCQGAWLLRREGATLSDQSLDRSAAGTDSRSSETQPLHGSLVQRRRFHCRKYFQMATSSCIDLAVAGL